MSWQYDGYPYRRLNWFDKFGSLQITETSPFQTPIEPVTLQNVKDALRIIDAPGTDPGLERNILELIPAARATAEEINKRRLVRCQFDLTYDYWLYRRIKLSPPLASVDLIQTTDIDGNQVALVAGTQYKVDRTKRVPVVAAKQNVGWPSFTPSESSSVLIRHTSGFVPTDPWWTIGAGAAVKRGIYQLISFWLTQGVVVTKGVGQAEELPWTISQLLGTDAIVTPG